MCNLTKPLRRLEIVYFSVVSDAIDADLSGCSHYPDSHGCREMLWTAGQRYDLAYKPSSFVWKYLPGTGSCCNGMCSYAKFHAGLLAWKFHGNFHWNFHLWLKKSRVPVQLCGIVCVILSPAIVTQYWHVTDRQTDRHMMTVHTVLP